MQLRPGQGLGGVWTTGHTGVLGTEYGQGQKEVLNHLQNGQKKTATRRSVGH